MTYLLVFIGAGFGGVMRYAVGLYAARFTGFPYGTLGVNILGAFLMGVVMAWLSRHPNETLRLLLTTGVMGGFTTFSAFSYESLKLLQDGQMGLAAAYILLSVSVCLAACALGFMLGR